MASIIINFNDHICNVIDFVSISHIYIFHHIPLSLHLHDTLSIHLSDTLSIHLSDPLSLHLSHPLSLPLHDLLMDDNQSHYFIIINFNHQNQLIVYFNLLCL